MGIRLLAFLLHPGSALPFACLLTRMLLRSIAEVKDRQTAQWGAVLCARLKHKLSGHTHFPPCKPVLPDTPTEILVP